MSRGPTLSETEPAWGQAESLYQPRRPAFWLFVGLLALGVFVLFARTAPALGGHVGATSLTVVLWAAYALPFVLVILALDLLEPEPPAFLASAFAWGAIVSTSIAIVANSSTQSIMSKTVGIDFTRTWWPALSGPSTEEVLKGLGVVVIILIARRQVTTVLDGLIYGLFVGLGFQVAENIVYTADKIQSAVFSGTPGRIVLDVFVLRGVALGLWSHAVYTALVGFGIAYAWLRTDRSRLERVGVLVGLFAISWGLHFLWNAPFWQPNSSDGLEWSEVGLYIVKGLPALLLVVALYWLAHRREVVWFKDALAGESADVSADELDSLLTLRGRRAARAQARHVGGRAAGRAVRRVQRAQVRLAVACERADSGSDPQVESARASVRRARVELAQCEAGEG